MPEMPSSAAVAAWGALLRAARRCQETVEEQLKAAGLPPLAWYDVLHELATAPDGALRPFELTERMLLTQYNTSRLAARMVEAGVVERCVCTDDGRGQLLCITDEGRDLRRRMWAVYGPAIARLTKGLDDAGAQRLTTLLHRLA